MSRATITTDSDRAISWATKMQVHWAEIEPYQRFLYGVGFLLILSGIFHIGVYFVKGGSLVGPVSWRKPITFGFSIGLTALCISWLTNYLPKDRRKGWRLLGTLGVAGTLEVFLISMQQWRGVASHFNFFDNRFDAIISGSIALAIVPVSIAILFITVWAYQALRAPLSLRWAIRAGMTLLVIGTLLGGLMIFNAVTQFVNKTGLPPNIWGENGVMKLPHALAIHALQVLLVAAWLLRLTRWSESRRLLLVKVIGLAYVGLLTVSILQMLTGLAPLDLSLLPTAVTFLSTIILCFGYFVILVRVWQDQKGVT